MSSLIKQKDVKAFCPSNLLGVKRMATATKIYYTIESSVTGFILPLP